MAVRAWQCVSISQFELKFWSCWLLESLACFCCFVVVYTPRCCCWWWRWHFECHFVAWLLPLPPPCTPCTPCTPFCAGLFWSLWSLFPSLRLFPFRAVYFTYLASLSLCIALARTQQATTPTATLTPTPTPCSALPCHILWQAETHYILGSLTTAAAAAATTTNNYNNC